MAAPLEHFSEKARSPLNGLPFHDLAAGDTGPLWDINTITAPAATGAAAASGCLTRLRQGHHLVGWLPPSTLDWPAGWKQVVSHPRTVMINASHLTPAAVVVTTKELYPFLRPLRAAVGDPDPPYARALGRV